ncbi:MAG: regulatory protein GemA [Magnetospirillum sp. WYHS-4]
MTPDSRQKLTRAVHVAARAKGLDEDSRRDLYRQVTGKDTLTDMTGPEIGRVLDALNGKAGGLDKQVNFIAGLWRQLGQVPPEAGGVRDPSPAGLRAFVKLETGKDDLRFCGADEKRRLIEALKGWLGRVKGRA